MKTLLLDLDAWDLVLDASGNIATASEPYAIAQDVASACKTFVGDCWYDQEQGIPYFQQILGEYPPVQYMQRLYIDRALTVPGVADAQVVFTDLADRTPHGQIQIIDDTGAAQGITF